jgi:hypothetical protein
MPTLSLLATSASISAGVGKIGNRAIMIGYSVRIEPGRDLLLATKTKFNELSASVTIFKEDYQAPYRRGEIGSLTFFKGNDSIENPSSPSCIFEIFVPNEHWEALFQLATSGRVPSCFYITLPDLEYGSARDGTEPEWNNIDRPALSIESARYVVSISSPPSEVNPDEHRSDVVVPVTGNQINEIARKIAKLHEDAVLYTRVAILAAVIAMLLVLFR